MIPRARVPGERFLGAPISEGPRRSQTISWAPLLMQIRHNLVVPEKPFFRRGRCVVKAAYPSQVRRKHRDFSAMRRLRIVLALAGMAVCVTALAQVVPHARDA